MAGSRHDPFSDASRRRGVDGFHPLSRRAAGAGGCAAGQTATGPADQPGQLVSRIGLVIREGLVFGVIAGVFALLVRLVAVYATHDLTPTIFSNFINSALGFLIIGGAGRKLAASTKTTNPALQMGAIAGGVSQVFHTVVAAVILTYLPVGQGALDPLSPAAQHAGTGPGGQEV